LGKLALTDSGIFRREMQVLSTCVAAGYPVACVIGGGYADDLKSPVWRHSLVHRAEESDLSPVSPLTKGGVRSICISTNTQMFLIYF
jgi:acetoin utilization deacetylase AcuC-like enzyme